MSSHTIRITVFATFLGLAAATAQAQVCVRIDEAHDTLEAGDRAAAVLLLGRQFTLAGEQVAADCPTPYLVSHIKLGNTITVVLTGPKGVREGTALGLDDLPALYNQMVRSLITGRPMEGLKVVDRGNVTAAQSTAQRVHSDGFTYARLGYGGIFGAGERAYSLPSFGFGYRAELDKVAIDVSFLNFQMNNSDYYSDAPEVGTFSIIKLSGLYLVNRLSNSTPYLGGGLSWGSTNISAAYPTQPIPRSTGPTPTSTYSTGGSGSGLQGDLTAGYEFGRATNIRMFVQADATLPFYTVKSETISSRGGVISSTNNWTPSLVMSVGLGWGRNRK